MIDKNKRDEIIALIHREVVPAVGCTEPAAVSLAVAKATELLGERPEEVHLRLSGNIIKNAMGVGIPGTGMIGLPIAVALGVLVGKSEYGLEVLKDVTPEAVEEGRKYIDSGAVIVEHEEDAPSNLHIDVTVIAGHNTARAVISRSHTNFILLEKNEEVLYKEEASGDASQNEEGHGPVLDMATVYEFATETPIDEIRFILEARDLNLNAAKVGMEGGFGHNVGITIRLAGKTLYGDTPVAHMISYTSAACDARMGGATVPVMSNSGSGNQGITATVPVVSYAKDINASEEQLIRALTMSHLTSIYIKQSLGRLSALCGCVVASTGASSAITWLMGGKYEHVCAAIKNMVANLSGMLCDGAKPSCSMKISSGVSTAMMSAMLAMDGHCVSSIEGIVDESVDETVHNLTSIGRESMMTTDKQVLKIMTSK